MTSESLLQRGLGVVGTEFDATKGALVTPDKQRINLLRGWCDGVTTTISHVPVFSQVPSISAVVSAAIGLV